MIVASIVEAAKRGDKDAITGFRRFAVKEPLPEKGASRKLERR